jgi:hypothetical protein
MRDPWDSDDIGERNRRGDDERPSRRVLRIRRLRSRRFRVFESA